MIDWTKATVTIRAPVAFTATEEVQEFELPLATFYSLLTKTSLANLEQELRIAEGSDCLCGRYQDESHKAGCSRG